MEIEPLLAPSILEDDQITGVLKPAGYRILVRILPPEETAKRWKDSRLTMPDDTRDREWAAQLWGKVVETGPEAYKDQGKFPTGPWCKKGDAILMRPYSGTRFMVRGELYALINDDTVEGVVADPGEIERP
jgi:co-chaperonin GroES (HSP10)